MAIRYSNKFNRSPRRNQVERVGRRRELYSKNKRFGIRNPIARARYKSLQRRLARSQGREDAGAFTG